MKPDDLVKLVTTPMPYGKHKGMLIADLPGNYLNWFAREGFPQGEVGQLLRLMQEIDHNGLSDLLKPLRQGQPQKRQTPTQNSNPPQKSMPTRAQHTNK